LELAASVEGSFEAAGKSGGIERRSCYFI